MFDCGVSIVFTLFELLFCCSGFHDDDVRVWYYFVGFGLAGRIPVRIGLYRGPYHSGRVDYRVLDMRVRKSKGEVYERL